MKRQRSQTEYYTQKAKEEGFPARSVYKLKEIVEKFGLLKTGDRVLDLGCAPGSWLLYLAQKTGERGEVVGIDINEIKIQTTKNIIFLQKNVFDKDILSQKIFEKKFDLIVSDLAPKTTGMREKDVFDSFVLAKRTFEIAKIVLSEKGDFVCKIFESPAANDFLKEIACFFEKVRKYKPKATLKQSREFFIIAIGFSGPGADPVPLGTGSAPGLNF